MFDYADPSADADRCNSLSVHPDDERAEEDRIEEERLADDADQAEAEAALAREFPAFIKGAA